MAIRSCISQFSHERSPTDIHVGDGEVGPPRVQDLTRLCYCLGHAREKDAVVQGELDYFRQHWLINQEQYPRRHAQLVFVIPGSVLHRLAIVAYPLLILARPQPFAVSLLPGEGVGLPSRGPPPGHGDRGTDSSLVSSQGGGSSQWVPQAERRPTAGPALPLMRAPSYTV